VCFGAALLTSALQTLVVCLGFRFWTLKAEAQTNTASVGTRLQRVAWVCLGVMGNYPPHTQFKLDKIFLSVPSLNIVGIGLDMNNGQPAAGLFFDLSQVGS
jgi:hypothetical protein